MKNLNTWLTREMDIEADRYSLGIIELLAVVCPGGDEDLIIEAAEAGQRTINALIAEEATSGRSVFQQARRLFRAGAEAIDAVFQQAIAEWIAEVCQESAAA